MWVHLGSLVAALCFASMTGLSIFVTHPCFSQSRYAFMSPVIRLVSDIRRELRPGSWHISPWMKRSGWGLPSNLEWETIVHNPEFALRR